MQIYDKLKPLLEEYGRLNSEWRIQEFLLASNDPIWNVRQRVLQERWKELQAQIQQLTQMDRRLVN